MFDVRGRKPEELLTPRHRFTKAHASVLWRVWWAILAVNSGLAFTRLETFQLVNGSLLLVAALAYTFLNLKISSGFFAKEVLVAVIFAGGTVVFQPPPSIASELVPLALFAACCAANCLLIGIVEVRADERLGVRSLSRIAKPCQIRWLLCGIVIGTVSLPAGPAARLAITFSAALLFALSLSARRLPPGIFRTCADLCLFLPPLAWTLAGLNSPAS